MSCLMNFMVLFPSLFQLHHHRFIGKRNDHAPLEVIFLTQKPEDFFPEIPGEQEDDVRFFGEDLLRRQDGDVRAGRVPSVLDLVLVRDPPDLLLVNPAKIQQCGASRRCAVAGRDPSLSGFPLDQIEKLFSMLETLLSKLFPPLEAVQANLILLRKGLFQGLGRPPRAP